MQASTELWSQGIVGPWYLRPSQLDIYDLLKRQKNPFIEAARRFGKTTTILAHVLEQLRANPGWICRWCEPWHSQAREIVMPEIDKLQSACPQALKFRFQVTGSVYIGPGNSRIYLRGVNEDRGESARGPTAHIIVADEFGSWKDPEYTVNEVLRPQLLTTNGQFVFASSPAADLAHHYYEHRKRAVSENRFIQKTIYDNESLSAEKIAEIIQEVGGENKPAWKREYLCLPVSDPEKLVVPEFDEAIHVIDDDAPRPEYFDAYAGADFGLNDHTGFVFGYLDFRAATLVIEDEYFRAGQNTKQIVDECKATEARLWGDKPVFLRWGDNELQQLYDMQTLHGYMVSPTRKDDLLAALNDLRLNFGARRIKIRRRCKNLIYQLKVGLWNDQRTNFKRGEQIGHLDLIAALIYLHRNVQWNRNPYPLYGSEVTPYTHYLPDAGPQGIERPWLNDDATALDPLAGVLGD